MCFSIPTVVLAFFLTFQKATLGTGSLSRPGRLVLQQHGDMAFRSLCFSILNLNVVLAFFLTFQKATLGTGSPSQPGRLVLQQDWDLAFPTVVFRLAIPESPVKHWEPEPAGPPHPSGGLDLPVHCRNCWISILTVGAAFWRGVEAACWALPLSLTTWPLAGSQAFFRPPLWRLLSVLNWGFRRQRC